MALITRRRGEADVPEAAPRRTPATFSGACWLAAALVLLSSCAQAPAGAGVSTPSAGPVSVAITTPGTSAAARTTAAAPAATPSLGAAASVEAAAVSAPTPGPAATSTATPTSESTQVAPTPTAAPTQPARNEDAGASSTASAPETAAPRAQPGTPVFLQPGTQSVVILAQPAAGQGPPASPLRAIWTKRLAAGVLAAGVNIPAGQAPGPLEIVAQDGGDVAKETVQVAPAMVLAQGFGSPDDVTVGRDGTIVFSDFGNQGVNALVPGGRPVPLGTGIKEPEGVAVARDGSIVVADQQHNAALRLDPATHRLSTIAAIRNQTGADGIDGLALDPDTGDVLFPDSPNGRLLRISPDGKSITPLPGKYARPTGVAKLPGGGYVVVDEFGGRVYKIDAAGHVVAIGGTFATPDDVVLDPAGDVLINSLGDGTIKAIAPDGRVTTLLAGLRNPHGLNVDGAGNLIVADSDRNRLLRLVRAFAIDPPASAPTTLPATVPLTIARALGFSGAVAWRVVSAPPGVTAAINADPATPDLAMLSLSGTVGAPGRVLVEATSGQRHSVVQMALGPS